MKLSEHFTKDSKESHPMFQCTLCNCTHTTKKELGTDIKVKHRIFQPDGIDDSYVEDSEEDDTVI